MEVMMLTSSALKSEGPACHSWLRALITGELLSLT
jgi:hypothetical protein